MEKRLEQLNKEGKEAVDSRNYEKAAELRDESEKLQKDYKKKRGEWMKKRGIDDEVTEDDIAHLISGIQPSV